MASVAADSWPWASEFEPETLYFNTASLGLPPRRAMAALQDSLNAWRTGRAQAPAFDPVIEHCRQSYAALIGVPRHTVAIGSQVSAMVAPVAASVPDGAEVLVVEGEFTSVSFPFLAHAGRGVRVREVPLADLPGAVGADTALVAVAAAQSADGSLVDLPALKAAAARHDVRLLIDLTQAAGWLPLDLDGVAYTVCGGYKWLLAPRGTGYLTVREDLIDTLVPQQAGWYAGADRWSSIYGGPLRLAEDARRFDVSPAWPAWVGAAPALDLLLEVGVPALHRHAVGLARRFAAGVGLAEPDSAIVSCPVDASTMTRLHEAEVMMAERAGKVRFAFHLSNTADEVDRLIELF